MIETIGSWVYLLSTALIVVAFIELLVPRTATSGLVKAVVGLCVVALLLDVMLNLASEGLRLDFEFGPPEAAGSAVESWHRSEGETLASGTLAVVQSASSAGEESIQSAEAAVGHAPRSSSSSAGVDRISVSAIARVEVGGERD